MILTLGGTLRTLSSNSALLRAAASCSSSVSHAPVTLEALPFFNEDVEKAGLPPSVAELRKAAFEAKAFLFATPEYNGFLPASLKNAIDWLSRSGKEGVSPLKGKPFAVVSAGGGGGGLRAQANMLAIGRDFKMQHVAGPSPIAVKLFDGTRRFSSSTGDLEDKDVIEAVKALVAKLEAAAKTYAAKS